MNSHVTKYRQVRQALLEIENRYHGIRKIKLDVRRDEIKIDKIKIQESNFLGFFALSIFNLILARK
jgi:hypothetical protein